MKTVLHNCPSCRKPHALVWYQRKSGKRQLGVICDSLPVLRHRKGDVRMVQHTSFAPLDTTKDELEALGDLSDIPTVFTPAARDAEASRGQHQLAMMLVKDGEQVERSVETPRRNVGAEIDAKIAKLLLEINQALQAAKELDTQIMVAEKKRRAFRELAQAKGAELSVLQTSEFKLSP